MQTSSPSSHSGRRKVLLDPEWQLAVFRNVAVVAVAVGVLQAGVTFAVSSLDPIERWSGATIGWLAVGTNLVFLGLVFLAIWTVTVRMTHSVVGPASVIRAAVLELKEGRHRPRLALRKNDYLQSLASSVSELAERLEERARIVEELEQALARRDLERAESLVSALRGSAPREERECAA